MKWIIDYHKHPKLRNPVLVEGLPGIGNVGKIAVDFMIDEIKAEKMLDIFSYHFPHSVFVNEKNLVELPSISMYYKKGKQDILLLAGDIQPVDDTSCYEFCEQVINIVKKFGGKEIITLGGIGLSEVPEKPKIFITGNNDKIVKKYKTKTIETPIYGIVGPVIGVTGVLVGLSNRMSMNSVSMLAETYGHPMYLGMKGAREILKILIKKLDMKIDIKSLNKEIERIEHDLTKKAEDLYSLKKQTGKVIDDNNYIG